MRQWSEWLTEPWNVTSILRNTAHLRMILESSGTESAISNTTFRYFYKITIVAAWSAPPFHRGRSAIAADALQFLTYASNVLVGIRQAPAQNPISMLPKGFVLSAGCHCLIFLG